MCCECGTPWGPGQTWKTSYRFQSRELWYGTSCRPLCQRLKPSHTSSLFTWSSLISPVRTNFSFPFCFSVPAAVCAREGACGLCSLQAIKGGGVEGLILWREKLHDRELIVQVSQIASKFYPIITFFYIQFCVWFVSYHLGTSQSLWLHASGVCRKVIEMDRLCIFKASWISGYYSTYFVSLLYSENSSKPVN